MNTLRICTYLCALLLCGSLTSATQAPEATVPRLVKFAGILKDPSGQPRTGSVVIRFALYENQKGGDPLWRESQVVDLDEQGRYSVLLGASEKEGLPLELFGTGKAAWLGVRVEGDEEQPRIQLAAVPYALKAGDAETLGGRPLSAYVLADTQSQSTSRAEFNILPPAATPSLAIGLARSTSGIAPLRTAAPSTLPPRIAAIDGSGTPNAIPKFIGVSTIGDSVMAESSGRIGIGTASPSAKLHANVDSGGEIARFVAGTDGDSYIQTIAGTSQSYLFSNRNSYGGVGSITNHDFAIRTSNTDRMYLTTAGNVGIGTTSPNYLFHLHGRAGTHSLLQFTNAATGGTRGDGGYFGYLNGETDFRIYNQENSSIRFFTNATERVRIASDGRVGIGTTNPNYLLQVNTSTYGVHSIAQFTNAATGATAADGGYVGYLSAGRDFYFNNLENGSLVFSTNGTEKARITPTGDFTISQTGSGIVFRDGSLQTTGIPFNTSQVAILRWYESNDAGLDLAVGISPQGIAFDGYHIWVANSGSDTVTKIRTIDGANLGSFGTGTNPTGVAFDDRRLHL